ncbi:uncharacterized protein LOC118173697 [Oxyura jamaicensis]|uniref:uncharacterized protein LOC118173697 n=1 Tax=Oxyura jamaicensis TaxID=8884 RepID=UPI0015A6210B|nr:uncharacterized protein LOC118173697 [Oxyura jamaicensis]
MVGLGLGALGASPARHGTARHGMAQRPFPRDVRHRCRTGEPRCPGRGPCLQPWSAVSGPCCAPSACGDGQEQSHGQHGAEVPGLHRSAAALVGGRDTGAESCPEATPAHHCLRTLPFPLPLRIYSSWRSPPRFIQALVHPLPPGHTPVTPTSQGTQGLGAAGDWGHGSYHTLSQQCRQLHPASRAPLAPQGTPRALHPRPCSPPQLAASHGRLSTGLSTGAGRRAGRRAGLARAGRPGSCRASCQRERGRRSLPRAVCSGSVPRGAGTTSNLAEPGRCLQEGTGALPVPLGAGHLRSHPWHLAAVGAPGVRCPPGMMAPCVSHPALHPRCQHCSGCRQYRCSCRSSVCPPAGWGGLAPDGAPLLASPGCSAVVVCWSCWSQPWGTGLWVGWGRTPVPGTVVGPEGPSPASHLAPSRCGRAPSAEGDLDAPPGGDRVRSERLLFTVN